MWRGRALAGLGKGDPAAHLRPTPDRVRESLFNILAHWPDTPLRGARVLDLFAGTGALGLEALSRGAAQATFVDNGRRAQALLTANIDRLDAQPRARILGRDATRLGQADAPPADLVFLDPPYGKGLGDRALTAANAGGWIVAGALILWEEAHTLSPPPGFSHQDTRQFGRTTVQILTRD